jgi:hypothetical protein
MYLRLSETKMRVSEKTVRKNSDCFSGMLNIIQGLNKLRKHNDIRFEIKGLEKTADKVFLLIQVCAALAAGISLTVFQAVLGGISLNNADYKSADSQPQLEAFGIFRHVSRIARGISHLPFARMSLKAFTLSRRGGRGR